MGILRMRAVARSTWVAPIAVALAAIATVLVWPSASRPASAALPASFTDTVVFNSGLGNPVNVRFSPDGRVFVAQKGGQLLEFDSLSDPTPTTILDLSGQTHDYWDRGMLGLALDPNFPASPYIY